jgi:hypothetical protein
MESTAELLGRRGILFVSFKRRYAFDCVEQRNQIIGEIHEAQGTKMFMMALHLDLIAQFILGNF